MIRLALLSDIHDNLPALQAVEADIATRRVSQIALVFFDDGLRHSGNFGLPSCVVYLRLSQMAYKPFGLDMNAEVATWLA